MTNQCKHGQLARQCEICELEQKCAEHWQARNEAERRASEYKDRCGELERENRDLQEDLTIERAQGKHALVLYGESIGEMEKRLEDAERLVVKTLCSNCNKEYTLSLDSGLSNNFSRCPHCGERNDRWIRIWRG